MARLVTDADRKVIPRWRTYDATRKLGELDSAALSRRHPQVTADFMASKIVHWQKHKSIGHASDLVGTGLSLGRSTEVADAAHYLLREDLSVSSWARELATCALNRSTNSRPSLSPKSRRPDLNPTPVDIATLHARVKTLRSILRAESRDPISWVDLARAYACLGLGDQANRCMTIAYQLGGNNRFVLRSASRLSIYLDDPGRAHDMLIRSDSTRHDPWLLAAEIAISSITSKTSRLVRTGQRILAGQQFSPRQVSELASAIATLELDRGSVRKSKRLFRQSLQDPTENSIAQAAWAARHHRGIGFDHEFLNRPNTFEAESWTSFRVGQWQRAVESCKLWLFDQPFSSRPAIQGSFLAAITLEDYATSEYFAQQGLMAKPWDAKLLNNLAFALINLGKLDEGRHALAKATRSQLSQEDRTMLQATHGLLEIRAGNIQLGRELYSRAYSMAERIKGGDRGTLLALASTFQVFEEAAVVRTAKDIDETRALLNRALIDVRRTAPPVSTLLEDRLTRVKSQLDNMDLVS